MFHTLMLKKHKMIDACKCTAAQQFAECRNCYELKIKHLRRACLYFKYTRDACILLVFNNYAWVSQYKCNYLNQKYIYAHLLIALKGYTIYSFYLNTLKFSLCIHVLCIAYYFWFIIKSNSIFFYLINKLRVWVPCKICS